MGSPKSAIQSVTSGVDYLDRLLGGLFIGDNVLWLDQAGSLATVFCLNLLQSAREANQPLVYVTFDRSPRNLFEKLGALAENPNLTILDCFTWGKGSASDIFLSFYTEPNVDWPCEVVRVEEPRNIDRVTSVLADVHSSLHGYVRFIFESVTGMQELWGGEEQLLGFYSHACPRLYELNTIAYWVMEKDAHTPRFRARISQIAQVVIDLAIKRGSTSLSILKAEKRGFDNVDKLHSYWTKDLSVTFEGESGTARPIDLGSRLKDIRTRRRISQTELAKFVGVTPSTISQVESNLIYPSLPALLKMAEVLAVDVSAFFQDRAQVYSPVVFSATGAVEAVVAHPPEGSMSAKALTPVDADFRAEPYLIEIAPKTRLSSHFFSHKGEEMGYLLSGKLELSIRNTTHKVRSGDIVYLTSEFPSQWKNPGPNWARMLWIKVR